MNTHDPRALLPGPYDLAVIGGGINGVGIAHDAALRGKSVVLLEKADIAEGTSSRSSKMLHGGIRYLEHLRIGLVFEALRERGLLLSLAPHLTRKQPFLIPVYKDAKRGPFLIRVGLFLYDILALGRRIGRSEFLTPAAASERAPELTTAGLRGCGVYHDVVMDDARLCLAVARAAVQAGAPDHPVELRNYAEVLRVRSGSPHRLEIRDHITGKTTELKAANVVRALGPWTDPEDLVPSKGAHIVLPKLPFDDGVLITHSRDGRVFFVIPWLGRTIVGTTESPFTDDPGSVRASADDVAYLLDGVHRLFPKLSIGSGDVLGTYAGVRPLARSGRAKRTGAPGKVSRHHKITHESGVYNVFGGKYTTFRRVAKDVVDRIYPGSRCSTGKDPYPGGQAGTWEQYRANVGEREAQAEALARGMFSRYGSESVAIEKLIDEQPELAEEVAAGTGITRAEVVHCVHNEFVHYPADFLARRTSLRFIADGGRSAYDEVERLIREHAQYTPIDLEAARAQYFEQLEHDDVLRETVAGAHAP